MQLSTLQTAVKVFNAIDNGAILHIEDASAREHAGYAREFRTASDGTVTGFRLTTLRGLDFFFDLESVYVIGAYTDQDSQDVADAVYG